MKILILILSILILPVNSYAENIDVIKKNIDIIKEKISVLDTKNQQSIIKSGYIDFNYVDKELVSLQDELGDLYYNLAKSKSEIVDISTLTDSNSSRSVMSFKTSNSKASSFNPETGDIIVFKPKKDYSLWWAFADHGWQHAAIFYSPTEIVQAVSPGNDSVKMLWNDFTNDISYDLMDKVMLIKMNLTSSEKSSIQFYMDTFQVGIPYPSKYAIPFTKYSVDTFYCSSLVWAAHKWSASKVDLDTVESKFMVWPVDLLNSSTSYQHVPVKW